MTWMFLFWLKTLLNLKYILLPLRTPMAKSRYNSLTTMTHYSILASTSRDTYTHIYSYTVPIKYYAIFCDFANLFHRIMSKGNEAIYPSFAHSIHVPEFTGVCELKRFFQKEKKPKLMENGVVWIKRKIHE